MSQRLALRWAIVRPWFVVSLVRTEKRHIQWTAERWLSDIPHKSCTSLPPLPRQWPRYLPLPGSTPPPQALSTAPGRGSRLVPGPARCSRAGIHYWVPVTNLGFGQGRAGRGVRGTAGFGPRATAHHCIHTGNRLTCLYWWPCQPRLPPVLLRSMPVRLPSSTPGILCITLIYTHDGNFPAQFTGGSKPNLSFFARVFIACKAAIVNWFAWVSKKIPACHNRQWYDSV